MPDTPSSEWLAAYNRVYGTRSTGPDDDFRAAYRRVYGTDLQDGEETEGRSALSNFARGAIQGLGTAGTSTIGAIGTLTGSDRLRGFADRTEAEMREFYDPQGRAGRAGEIGGRVVGELGTGIVGGGAGVKAATKLSPRIAGAMAGASRLQRGAAVAAANAPIDIVQGAKADEGIVLPGRLGSIFENVALTGAAGALLPAARAARQPAPETRRLGPGQYEMGPATFVSREVPETNPARMIPGRTGPEPSQSPFVAGPGLPGQPVVEPIRDPRRLLGSRSRGIVPEQVDLTGPAIPLTADAGDLTARNRGVIPSRSGQTFRRPTSIQRALEEAEREAIRAADVPSAVPVARFPTSFKNVSDDQLRATAVEWQKRLEDATAKSNILSETEVINFDEAFGTKALGYGKAKRLTGTKEDARRAMRYSEEQLGRLEELGLTPEDLKVQREAAKALPKIESQFARINAEMDKRGLSFVDEALDFPFGRNRSGVVNPQLLATGGGAALGGTIGAATAPEGEDAFGVGGRAIAGAALGAGLGRLGVNRMTRTGAPDVPRGTTGTVPPKRAGFPERTTPLDDPNINPDDYANINRMTANEPQLADDLRESMAGTVGSRELGERLPPRGKEVLGRLKNAESETILRQRVADLYGVKPSDIVARTAAGERVGREAILKATEEIMNTQQRINTLNARLRTGLVADPAEVARIEAMLGAERSTVRDLLASVSTQKTELGRDMAAMRLGASLSTDPVVWKENLEELAKRALTADEIAQAEKLALDGDLRGLTRLGNEVRKASTSEKFITAYKASLLSSPKTHIINFTGNMGMGALRQLRDIPATFADMALARMTGQRSKVLNAKGRLGALRRGTTEGVADARAVLRGDVPVSNRFMEARETNYDNAFANLYTKGVFRALDASDRIFKGQAFAESIDEQLRVIAKNRGLTGRAAEEFVARTTAAPTMDVVAEAMLDAERATFQQTTELSKAAVQLRDRLGTFGQLLFPFAKTPANIATTITNYTPLGLAGPEFRRNAKKVVAGLATTREQRMVAERLGEASTGGLLLLAGYLKAKKDEMTGFYPSDERTRAQWESERRMEGAVRVGDQWVQVNRLSPVGNLLTIGAALADIEKGDPDILSLAIGSVAAPLSAVTDLPMVQGVSNLSEALSPEATPEQRKSAMLRIGGGMVAGAIPFSGLLRSTAQTTDPLVRETRAEGRLAQMGNQVLAGLPGASRTLPAKVSPLGDEMRRGGSAFERFASPFPRQTDMGSVDPLVAALREADTVVGRVPRRKGETPEAYQARATRTGQVVRAVTERAMQSPALRSIDTMNVERIQRQLEAAGVDTEGKDADDLRAALRTQMLERVIARGKSVAAKQFRERVPPRARALDRILTRQP